MRRATPRLVLGALALLLLGASRPPGLGDVVEVRHWSYPDYTRVVVELDRPVRIKTDATLLAARAGRPERLYLDLEGIWVGTRFVDGLAVKDGLLRDIRVGQNTRSAIRLVLDLDTYERHRVLTLSHPDRLVVDVYGRREGGETLRWGPEREEPPRLPAALRPVHTVVLDPGHGGRDPGALGVGGLREKDVTLRLARYLAKRLEKQDFHVVTTRDGDRTLSLEERTAIAEASRGDVFVSIHANASLRRSVRGIETYFLDETHERHTVTVAARENGIDPSHVNPLQRTLARLRVSEVSPQSQRLAHFVQSELIDGLPGRYRPVPDLGVKKGPFYVLFLSSMPAILVETGFLTNRAEARRLADSAYLEAVAERIARGLVRYRDEGPAVTARSDP